MAIFHWLILTFFSLIFAFLYYVEHKNHKWGVISDINSNIKTVVTSYSQQDVELLLLKKNKKINDLQMIINEQNLVITNLKNKISSLVSKTHEFFNSIPLSIILIFSIIILFIIFLYLSNLNNTINIKLNNFIISRNSYLKCIDIMKANYIALEINYNNLMELSEKSLIDLIKTVTITQTENLNSSIRHANQSLEETVGMLNQIFTTVLVNNKNNLKLSINYCRESLKKIYFNNEVLLQFVQEANNLLKSNFAFNAYIKSELQNMSENMRINFNKVTYSAYSKCPDLFLAIITYILYSNNFFLFESMPIKFDRSIINIPDLLYTFANQSEWILSFFDEKLENIERLKQLDFDEIYSNKIRSQSFLKILKYSINFNSINKNSIISAKNSISSFTSESLFENQ